MHASADRRNVSRTILRALAASDLSGAVLVPDGDPRGPESTAARWVRVTLTDARSEFAGRDTAGNRIAATRLIVTADVFLRDGSTAAVASVDDVDLIASRVRNAFAFVDLPLLNLTADPTGATPVTGYALRAMGAPRVTTPTTTDGYQRRQVSTELLWMARED